MALNLKNPQTLQAIDELAHATGQTKSDAVASAVEARLAAILAEQDAASQPAADVIEERLRALISDSSARFPSGGARAAHQDADLTADLYDELGLPR